MGLRKRSEAFNPAPVNTSSSKSKNPNPVVALAGNPNVGKSTLFNALTGMHQHTGNWPGKTVACAQGICPTENGPLVLVDVPGTYSLHPRSAEEEVAGTFICFDSPAAAVVVCDGGCLGRSLILALQIIETGIKTLVCVNLLDEAGEKGLETDLNLLSEKLGVPVIGTVAKNKKSAQTLTSALAELLETHNTRGHKLRYSDAVEDAVALIQPIAAELWHEAPDPRWLSLRLLEGEPGFLKELSDRLGLDVTRHPELSQALEMAKIRLSAQGITPEKLQDEISRVPAEEAGRLESLVQKRKKSRSSGLKKGLDRLLTGKLTAYPLMLLLLALVLWITVVGANYPSQLLSRGLFWIQDQLFALFTAAGAPGWLRDSLVMGVYRTLAWVVSVMLPPMAIFFPLFTILEDAGFLPRVAYNLDRPFKKHGACGKQALTMCMGLGCNAAGVVGCRIIDSPRERLLAVLTNSLVPCNGRFPAYITLATLFTAGAITGLASSFLPALLLAGIVLLGILGTFAATGLLSRTLLKGVPSSFVMEIPPFRRPLVVRVIVRSVLDRTLFVLGRAAAVAAPAGLVIWLLANITIGNESLLAICSGFLDPFGRFMGLDGVILMAFILGLPANEIVLPIVIMAYASGGSLQDAASLSELGSLLAQNGWTAMTAVNFAVFSLFHWPCSTTLMTIKKETGSLKWTLVAFLLPTLMGTALCIVLHSASVLFG